MSEEVIFDRSRQKIVNAVYFIIALSIASYGLYQYSINFNIGWELLIVIFVYLDGLFFISILFGAISKWSIDYVPGEWEKTKRFVRPDEYADLIQTHRDAYSGMTGSESAGCGICCFLFVHPIFIFGLLVYAAFATPLFSMYLDFLLLLVISYVLFATIGFVLGYNSPGVDRELPFENPEEDSLFNYMKALDKVDEIEGGFNVVIGERGKFKAVLDAEGEARVKGLPDTVALKVQISSSGFDYPYLVGTIYKGPAVKDKEEIFSVGGRYPALFEYSMDGEVTVIVARFKVPKKSSGRPYISEEDFEALGKRMAIRMIDLYETNQH